MTATNPPGKVAPRARANGHHSMTCGWFRYEGSLPLLTHTRLTMRSQWPRPMIFQEHASNLHRASHPAWINIAIDPNIQTCLAFPCRSVPLHVRFVPDLPCKPPWTSRMKISISPMFFCQRLAASRSPLYVTRPSRLDTRTRHTVDRSSLGAGEGQPFAQPQGAAVLALGAQRVLGAIKATSTYEKVTLVFVSLSGADTVTKQSLNNKHWLKD